MLKYKYLAVFLLVFLSGWFSMALSQDVPVDVKADQLRYIEGTDIVDATGSVEVKIQNIVIYADHLQMDPGTNLVTAEGRVRVFMPESQANADLLTYDANTEVSIFSKFRTRAAPSKVRGDVYLGADKLVDLHNKMLGNYGELTTCGNQVPHYWVFADRIEYYPDDKLIGYNVRLNVGDIPVWWMPYLYYDLQKQRKRNWAFGHNKVEGYYVKSMWDYPLGILYLDLMQYKGMGLGTEVGYNLMRWGLGSIYLYNLMESDTGLTDWVYRLHHTLQINPATKLTFDNRYASTYLIPSGRLDQTTGSLNLEYKDKTTSNLKLDALDDRAASFARYALQYNFGGQNSSANYYLNYEKSKNSPEWSRQSQRLSYRQGFFSSRVNFSTNIDYSRNDMGNGAPVDELTKPDITLSGTEKSFSWKYYSNWYINEGAKAGNNRNEYLEKLPEMELNLNTIDLKLLNLNSSLGLGDYHEVKQVPQWGIMRNYRAQRSRVSLNAWKNFPLGLGTAADLSLGIDQFFYAPGDQLYAYRESLSLQTNLFRVFRNKLSYSKAETDGNTPFFFDQLGTRYHSCREEMTFYYLDKVNWTTSGGFNWQAGKWLEVITGLTLVPDKCLSWNLNTGWDIENRRYKDLVNNLRYRPYSFLSLNVSSNQDINTGGLKTGSVSYDLYLLQGQPNQWHLYFDQVFDPPTQKFIVRNISLVKDLHCWELKYSYSDYRKEFSLVFGLKALPEETMEMSTGKGFYIDAFEKQLKEFNPEGEVRRY